MQNLSYAIIYALIWLLSKMPFFLLYRISDLMYILVYYVTPYRKNVVINNLKNAFPEKSDAEIRNIAKKFYHHLCDFLLESVKPFTISRKEIGRRFRYMNLEIFENFNREKRNFAVVSGHYGNWELNHNLTHYANREGIVIYRPLQNEIMDRIFKKIRCRYKGNILTPMENVYRTAFQLHSSGKPFFIWFIADQRPPRSNKFWTIFLNQPTSFYNGVEKLSRKLDLAVVFMHIEKVKRGYYEVKFKKLFDDVTGLPENAITLSFVNELETEIKQKPEFWLWSHKRWKHKPAEKTEIIKR
jgi:KDO2-lipid IV(A) lauroyltransferase